MLEHDQMLEHDEELQAIVHALETKPDVQHDDDFVARMMLRVPAQRVQVGSVSLGSRYGHRAAWIALAILIAVSVALSPRTLHSLLWQGVQMMLAIEVVAVLAVIAMTSRRIRG